MLRFRASETPEFRGYAFLPDGEGDEQHLTYGDLDRRAREIAVRLHERVRPGDRVLILLPSGLEYIAAFFGCLYAGVVAVPLYPPLGPHDAPRLAAVMSDAGATVALTTSDLLTLSHDTATPSPLEWLATDTVDGRGDAEQWRKPEVERGDVAYLQYTSGSTRTPKGVMVTHGNVLHNCAAVYEAIQYSSDSHEVGWIPLFHDMGLIALVLRTLFSGASATFMPPLAFLQRPARWLEAISRSRGTHSQAPNFAYDLCVARVTEEERAPLDLSSWRVAGNGAEPVRARTLERFAERFAANGFHLETFLPAYGLAEATLAVSCGPPQRAPLAVHLVRSSAERGRVVVADPSRDLTAAQLIACGRIVPGMEVRIVDEQSRRECADDHIGEIWVTGPSVARGYWNNPEETDRTFHARLSNEPAAGPFLRTGDLGFVRDGELVVTGRLKDLIIVGGRNVHPQDLEHVAENSHPALAPGRGAAFSIPVGHEESVVVAQELRRSALDADVQAVIRAIRGAVAQKLETPVDIVLLLPPGTITKTSSGKVQRGACRDSYVAHRLPVIASDERPAQTTPADTEVSGQKPDDDHLQGRLGEIWQRILGMDRDVLPADDFWKLGGKSLQASRMLVEAERSFGVSLPVTMLVPHATLGGMAAAIRERRQAGILSPRAHPVPRKRMDRGGGGNGARVAPRPQVVPVRQGGTRPPLLFVVNRTMDIFTLRHFLPALGPDQAVFALLPQNRAGLYEHNDSIRGLAAGLRAAVQDGGLSSPYYLCGHSFCGLLAYELAHQLRCDGGEVAFLGLLDTGNPKVEHAIRHRRQLARQRQVSRMGVRQRAAMTLDTAVQDVRSAWRRHTQPVPPEDDPHFWDREGASAMTLAYHPPAYQGPMVIFATPPSITHYMNRFLGWQDLHGGLLTSRPVPGDHVTMLAEPHVGVAASALAECLRTAQDRLAT
jgi:acyl-CoA synthetase (AMP-forming)/AMP-acid ligase II/thioesterase domain-containing protein